MILNRAMRPKRSKEVEGGATYILDKTMHVSWDRRRRY